MKWDSLTPTQKQKVIVNYISSIDDISDIQETMIQNLLYGLGFNNPTQQAYPLPLSEVISWCEDDDNDEWLREVLDLPLEAK